MPLTFPYQARDVIVANAEGKAILRAAVAEFCAAHPEVICFPSHEMAMGADPAVVYRGDKRHITRLRGPDRGRIPASALRRARGGRGQAFAPRHGGGLMRRDRRPPEGPRRG